MLSDHLGAPCYRSKASYNSGTKIASAAPALEGRGRARGGVMHASLEPIIRSKIARRVKKREPCRSESYHNGGWSCLRNQWWIVHNGKFYSVSDLVPSPSPDVPLPRSFLCCGIVAVDVRANCVAPPNVARFLDEPSWCARPWGLMTPSIISSDQGVSVVVCLQFG